MKRVHDRGIYLIGRIVVFEDPCSRVRGRTSRSAVRRLRLARRRRARLDEPVRPARLGVQRRRRRRGREGGVRRDHVRLRALPVRRRRRRRRLPQRAVAREADGDPGVPALREPPRAVRRAHLGRRVRSLRARSRHRPAPAEDGAVPRHGVRDDLPVAVRPGELGLQDPSTAPGATVARALRRFELALRGRDALVVPWVQDFSFSVPYGLDEVRAQIDAARLSGAKGYMLWNAEGVYTDGALAPVDSRREPLAAPAAALADVAHAVVEPVVAMRPELDRLRNEPVAAPERRKRDVAAREALLDLGDERVELQRGRPAAATAATPRPRSGFRAAASPSTPRTPPATGPRRRPRRAPGGRAPTSGSRPRHAGWREARRPCGTCGS